MRLPDDIYNSVRVAFAHHGGWHAVRKPENKNNVVLKALFPDVKRTDEPGSGEEFLRFHREMIQKFKWVIANTPGTTYVFAPWKQLPDNLAVSLGADFVSAMHAGVARLIEEGTADDLGHFLEARQVDAQNNELPGSGIHNQCHRSIGLAEAGVAPALTAGAKMNDLFEAPNNAHFWELHGWLDDIFAAWQKAHGETLQSPIPVSPCGC